jgi:hypothetical protein
MITLKQALGQIQRWCDYPKYDSLSDSRCAEIIVQQTDYIFNQQNLTGRPWNYSAVPITVTPNEDYHPITEVGDFGLPIAVETTDPQNNLGIREITIVDGVDGVRFFREGTLGPSGVASAAICVSFGEHPNQPGQWAARFGPKPNANATYTALYAPNQRRPQSLQDFILKYPQWEQYALIRSTCGALKFCSWEGMTKDENVANRAALLGRIDEPGSFAYQFKEFDTQFTRMARQPYQPHIARMIPFGRFLRGRTR